MSKQYFRPKIWLEEEVIHVGECAGAGNYDDSDGWGHPACTNRDPAPRREISSKSSISVVASQSPRSIRTRSNNPEPKFGHYYKTTVVAVAVSGGSIRFDMKNAPTDTLEQIENAAKIKGEELCRENSDQMKSIKIVELVLV